MLHPILQQPAIAYLILEALPQHDLLIVQRVCRLWRNTISASETLQARLFLRPDPAADANQYPAEVTLNPLLKERFPRFFWARGFNGQKTGFGDLGPWRNSHWVGRVARGDTTVLDPQRHKAYKQPGASWRRMIPCSPAPRELQVHFNISRYRTGTTPAENLRRLMFSDNGQEPPWLTFGLLYDLIEAAWFRNDPYKVGYQTLDFIPGPPAESRELEAKRQQNLVRMPLPWRYDFQQNYPQKQIFKPGCVCLDFGASSQSEEEIEEEMSEIIREGKGKGPEGTLEGTVLTTEFRVRDDRAISDIAWDEILLAKGI